MPTGGIRPRCSVANCNRPHSGRGFCGLHYKRWLKYGDPIADRPPNGTQRQCAVPGCERLAQQKVWCRGHYAKWWRYGDPLITLKPTQNKAMPWLRDHVAHKGKRCLHWPFGRNKKTGHGKVLFRGSTISASRAMCILAHGDPPTPKHQAAHSCGKAHEGCVNPQHLRWALPFENSEDRVRHGTAKQLTSSQREEIKELAKYMTHAAIARQYGFAQSSISHFLSGKRRPKYT
jgi:hypothetical protein